MSDALMPAKHGRDHCPGGIDPIPLDCLAEGLEPLIGGGGAAAYCYASKGAFAHNGGADNIPWDAVRTTDTSVFSLHTTTVTDDTIRVNAQGLIQAIAVAVIDVTANDWSIVTSVAANLNPSSGGTQFFSTGAYSGFALGKVGFGFRAGFCFDPCSVITVLTRVGAANYSRAELHLMYWPTSGNGSWTAL